MSPRRRAGRKILAAFLPIILIFLLALAALTGWLVYGVTHPPRRAYLVTPEKFASLSDRGLKATEETWANRDGTRARGWLVRGAEGAPAVVLLHRYGADRSWLLNLGVKLNETTNMTVLLPDLRGHGEQPPVLSTSLGTLEADDVLAALDFLRGLKTPQGRALVGDSVGLYGVELGAYAALEAARSDKGVRALALDSVPDNPDMILASAVKDRARLGTRLSFPGHYKNDSSCPLAESLGDRRALLLSGDDAGPLRLTTEALERCFPSTATVEPQPDLPPPAHT